MSFSTNDDCSSCDVIERFALRIDRRSRQAFLGDIPLELTTAEFRLLECLAKSHGQCVSRDALLDVLTGGDAIVGPRAVDVHICSLRRKLGNRKWIETVRGMGYQFRKVEEDNE